MTHTSLGERSGKGKKIKVNSNSSYATSLSATATHAPDVITQCYLWRCRTWMYMYGVNVTLITDKFTCNELRDRLVLDNMISAVQ